MNTLVGTSELVQENNSNNTSNNIKNILNKTISGFKNKLMGIVGSKKNEEKEIFPKNTKSEKYKKIFLNKETSEKLLRKQEYNNINIEELETLLKEEKGLLSHFRKIKEFLPDKAENEIKKLEINIEELEDKLIALRIQNLRIDAKFRPFKKYEEDWDKNIFNEKNKVEKNSQTLEDKIVGNISVLESKLKLEKKLLSYFQSMNVNDDDKIKQIKQNIKDIEDFLIKLEIQLIKITNKKNKSATNKTNIKNDIESLKSRLEIEKNLLNYYKNPNVINSKEIESIQGNIKKIEDQLITLKIYELKLESKKQKNH